MSDVPAARRIRAQASPRDPQTMRFILEVPIPSGTASSFDGPQEAAPLSVALFALEGVQKVKVMGETILVSCAPEVSWQALKAPVAKAIRRVLDATDQPLGEALADPFVTARDRSLLVRVNEVLDQKANPSIAKHRGRVTAESVEDGVVYLRMSGGCHGCASAALTLRHGVEKILMTDLPEIRDIVDVTDHATGEDPFYQGKPGQAPAFTRLIPADCIAWEDGELAIDPEYLASRLGLTPEQLQDGLADGSVTILTEPTPGVDADRTRVIVRGPQRAWAADVLPDGTAREVPPPRPLSEAEQALKDFPRRVRAYLLGLPPEKLPITYGRLARGLGLYAPGSVRKVTTALEETMREDARAERPFIAARVVSRGPAQSPGQGFFDLARALGHGPLAGETEAAFHRRHLAGTLGGE